MRIEYQHSSLRMAIELFPHRNGFRIEHYQYFGDPGTMLEKILGSIKSEVQLTLSELDILGRTLAECLHPKVEIVRGLQIVRDDSRSALLIEFSKSLDPLPLPTHVVQQLIQQIGVLRHEASTDTAD